MFWPPLGGPLPGRERPTVQQSLSSPWGEWSFFGGEEQVFAPVALHLVGGRVREALPCAGPLSDAKKNAGGEIGSDPALDLSAGIGAATQEEGSLPVAQVEPLSLPAAQEGAFLPGERAPPGGAREEQASPSSENLLSLPPHDAQEEHLSWTGLLSLRLGPLEPPGGGEPHDAWGGAVWRGLWKESGAVLHAERSGGAMYGSHDDAKANGSWVQDEGGEKPTPFAGASAPLRQ